MNVLNNKRLFIVYFNDKFQWASVIIGVLYEKIIFEMPNFLA